MWLVLGWLGKCLGLKGDVMMELDFIWLCVWVVVWVGLGEKVEILVGLDVIYFCGCCVEFLGLFCKEIVGLKFGGSD